MTLVDRFRRVARRVKSRTLKAHIVTARDAQEMGDWASAERSWRRVVTLEPARTSAWVQLGNMLNELSRYDEAIDAFSRAALLAPSLATATATAGIAGVYERMGAWKKAEIEWKKVIGIYAAADSRDTDDIRKHVHAYVHAAMSANEAGNPAHAKSILGSLKHRYPDARCSPDHFRVRLKLLDASDRASVICLLTDYVDLFPDEIGDQLRQHLVANDRDIASTAQRLISHAVKYDLSYELLSVSSALAEGLSLWTLSIHLHDHLYRTTGKTENLKSAFRHALQARMTGLSRSYARELCLVSRSFDALHELAALYELTGDQSRSRLIYRFLIRVWPHSRWHVEKYSISVGRTFGLEFADRFIQKQIKAGRDDAHLSRAYCSVAFECGDYRECFYRAKHHLKVYNWDHEVSLLMGYALANYRSIADAEQYFAQLAINSKQDAAAMKGVAHMAMRRRDLEGALAQWLKITRVHPEDINARTEVIRLLHAKQGVQEAVHAANEMLHRKPTLTQVRELVAWILTFSGRYQEAMAHIDRLHTSGHKSWTTIEMAVICSINGSLQHISINDLLANLPAIEAAPDQKRLYDLFRVLISLDRRDLVEQILSIVGPSLKHCPWAFPYLSRESRHLEQYGQIAREWQEHADLVCSDITDMLKVSDDKTIAALLDNAARQKFCVHIVNKFEQDRGGSELHALDLATQLRQYVEVRLWSPEMPHPYFTTHNLVSPIQGASVGNLDVLVIVGVYFDISTWIRTIRPRRVIVLYNTFDAPRLFNLIKDVHRATGVKVELLFCSDMMQLETGLPGLFEPSPTDLLKFHPAASEAGGRGFRIGRHSRDVVEKHGADDWHIYHAVAHAGGSAIVLGATCMSHAFPAVEGVDLLPARSEGIPEFLNNLDAYFYRTSTWVEPWGRVVIEAMACALPVIVHARGGYAQVIEHGVNGFLFESTQEALSLTQLLMSDEHLRAEIGMNARRAVEKLLSVESMSRMSSFYFA